MMSTAAVLERDKERVWWVSGMAAKLNVVHGGPGEAQRDGAARGQGMSTGDVLGMPWPFLSARVMAAVDLFLDQGWCRRV
jgi:hypothetical protein